MAKPLLAGSHTFRDLIEGGFLYVEQSQAWCGTPVCRNNDSVEQSQAWCGTPVCRNNDSVMWVLFTGGIP